MCCKKDNIVVFIFVIGLLLGLAAIGVLGFLLRPVATCSPAGRDGGLAGARPERPRDLVRRRGVAGCRGGLPHDPGDPGRGRVLPRPEPACAGARLHVHRPKPLLAERGSRHNRGSRCGSSRVLPCRRRHTSRRRRRRSPRGSARRERAAAASCRPRRVRRAGLPPASDENARGTGSPAAPPRTDGPPFRRFRPLSQVEHHRVRRIPAGEPVREQAPLQLQARPQRRHELQDRPGVRAAKCALPARGRAPVRGDSPRRRCACLGENRHGFGQAFAGVENVAEQDEAVDALAAAMLQGQNCPPWPLHGTTPTAASAPTWPGPWSSTTGGCPAPCAASPASPASACRTA